MMMFVVCSSSCFEPGSEDVYGLDIIVCCSFGLSSVELKFVIVVAYDCETTTTTTTMPYLL